MMQSRDSDRQNTSARSLAESARQGNDGALKELIRMAEGGRRSLLSAYQFPDQTEALVALGESARKEALEYLRSLKIRKERYIESCTGLACGSDHYPQWSAISYEFPNAKKELGEKLSYTGKKFDLASASAPLLSEEEHILMQKNNPWHRMIDAAIRNLEKSVRPECV